MKSVRGKKTEDHKSIGSDYVINLDRHLGDCFKPPLHKCAHGKWGLK